MAEIRYSTVGLDEINGVTKKVCHDVNATCRHLGHHETGHEGRTLGPLHAFCVANPNATVAYIHTKGSSSERHPERQRRSRRALLRGLGGRGCVAAIVHNEACDVCSAHFAAMPHQHVDGNMWLARCSYVATLLPPVAFQLQMSASGKAPSAAARWRGG